MIKKKKKARTKGWIEHETKAKFKDGELKTARNMRGRFK